MQFDMSLKPAGARGAPRGDDAPLRLLLLADLGGDRAVPLRARKPLAMDIDSFDTVLARVAPCLKIELDGQPLALAFAGLGDFHPDSLFARLPAFAALRRLRDEARDPTQFRRVAAALGLASPVQTPAAPAADAANDIERLLGRAPQNAAAVDPGTAALDRWLRALVSPHAKPDTAHEQQAVVQAIDSTVSALMRRVLHDPAFQALEAAWLGADRLVRGLELGEALTLWVLDVSRAELLDDLGSHRADLSASALHAHFSPGGGADAQAFGLLALDQAFGPDADQVQALAALGALAARAGAPLLAGATAALAGAADLAALAEPRRWMADDDETLAFWQALRSAPMAPWLGLVLPRVLMRLPYGAATDPINAFAIRRNAGRAPAQRLPVGRRRAGAGPAGRTRVPAGRVVDEPGRRAGPGRPAQPHLHRRR